MSYITSISTAVPEFCHKQESLIHFYESVSNNESTKRKIRLLTKNSGIETRYSVIPDYSLNHLAFTFFSKNKDLSPLPGYDLKMSVYKKEALKLALHTISKIDDFQKTKNEITHIITVSCTGLYAPGLDVDLILELGLNKNIQRYAINYMGCNAAIPALKLADSLCQSSARAKVLIVGVELCTLHFVNGHSDDYLLSNSLFADGCACVIVESNDTSFHQNTALKINSFYSQVIENTKEEMAWNLTDEGFKMQLKSSVPTLIRKNIKNYLTESPFNITDTTSICLHPGGRKILDEVKEELNFTNNELQSSYSILSQYGNMSSTTILFVLQEEMKLRSNSNNLVLLAFGPGLTIEGCELHHV